MRLKRRDSSHMIEFIFPLVLFMVFAISALTVLLLATNIYRKTTENSRLNFTSQTAIAYIEEKVHQSDNLATDEYGGDVSCVSIGEFAGTDALMITQNVDGAVYTTCIYEYDGELREIFTRDLTAALPESGRSIIKTQDFTMEELSYGLYRFTCTDADGRTTTACIATRCK